MELQTQLFIAFAMTLIIHAAETLSYSVRLAGVRLNKIAVALSLSGIIVLVSRTANIVQAPLTAKFVDFAKSHAAFDLLRHYRIVLLGASVGTLLAIALFPTFVHLFGRIISRLEIAGSLPKLVASVSIGQLRNPKRFFRAPRLRISQYRYLGISKKFILLNAVVTAFYSIGVLSSLYAMYLFPEYGATASQASGFINGIATILLTVFIDPQMGLITDKALNDDRRKDQLGKIYVLMMTTRFMGTMLAQLVLVPSALLIGGIIQFF